MKISLRSLLVVVAMFALVLGWWIDHARLQNKNARLNAEKAQLNAENAQLIGRAMPSSGFTYPSGLVSKTHHLVSSPEDRKELLFLLDNSWTPGKDADKPVMTEETSPKTR